MSEKNIPEPSEIFNAVTLANEEVELKGLQRRDRKEHKRLRELLTELNPFKIRFVEQYIRTASASESARLAGSQSKTPEVVGYKTLQDPIVQQCIAIAMKMRIEAVGLDTLEVIQKIREVYDAAMEAGKYDSAIKACDLLQKEIERASKVIPSKAGEAFVNKNKPITLEDGVDAGTELSNVLSLIQSKS